MVKRDRLAYDKEWINIKAFVLARTRFFEEIAQGNRHRINTYLDDCGKIWFNEIELQRIIDNNLSNAIKYAKRDTDITVELYQEGTDVIVRFITYSRMIEDTAKIFEPFHREDEIESGFGLGLEIVGSICKKESVGIEVDSGDRMTIFAYRFKRKVTDESTSA
jgi:signal transduction histidine kinase